MTPWLRARRWREGHVPALSSGSADRAGESGCVLFEEEPEVAL